MAFKPGSRRARLAGTPLCTLGNRPIGALLHEVRGDWKFLRECLHLKEHYNSKGRLCHRCFATKRRGPQHFGDFRRTAPSRALVSHQEFERAQRARGNPTPLLDMPRFNIARVHFDLMHCMDLGILQVAVPSALHELTRDASVFPGRALNDRLEAATAAYHEWCAANGHASNKARAITRPWVTLPHPQIGQLHCKAAAMRTMAYWVRDVCAPLQVSRAGHVRWAFFYYLCSADEVMRRAGRHLRRAEHEAVACKTESALQCYAWLHHRSRARGIPLWKILPKHHAWTHIAYDNMGVNPRAVHCYMDEDMVG